MIDASDSVSIAEKKRTANEKLIKAYALYISLLFLVASPIAVIYTKEWDSLKTFGKY